MRWARYVAGMRMKILVGKSDGKRLLGRPRSKWEDNIRKPELR
jgi:hypothetical protein